MNLDNMRESGWDCAKLLGPPGQEDAPGQFRIRHSSFVIRHFAPRAFTLIEMLTVIAVISVLAAMIFPVTKAINRTKIRSRLRTEMEQLTTAIDLYKAKLGHYPPDNHFQNSVFFNPYLNQLYYELAGTILTNNPPNSANAVYATMDGRSQLHQAAMTRPPLNLGVSGFANSSTPASAEEGSTAVDCLKGTLRADQLADAFPGADAGNGFKVIVGSIPLPPRLAPPNPAYPGAYLGPAGGYYCAWRYNSSNPTYNPSAYDLWINVVIDGRTNRICNWSRDPVVVNAP